MTGYGKASIQLDSRKLSVELRSLNSKQIDINTRIPQDYKEKESELRNTIANGLLRGKVDYGFFAENTGAAKVPILNKELVSHYMKQFKEVLEENNASSADLLGPIMRLPDVMSNPQTELDPDEWAAVKKITEEAIQKLQEHRADEGAVLEKELRERIENIRANLNLVPQFEEDRIQRLKDRLKRSLEELREKMDENRFEQELIYYLEKFDVTEEKVRLKTHLDYFLELIEIGGPIGKKLGFVSQEIGREVNTLGSKANHSEMQKLVVEMKDELEKIKEQLLNIL